MECRGNVILAMRYKNLKPLLSISASMDNLRRCEIISESQLKLQKPARKPQAPALLSAEVEIVGPTALQSRKQRPEAFRRRHLASAARGLSNG